MIAEIEQAQHELGIEGLSLLGGEPFAHANAGATSGAAKASAEPGFPGLTEDVVLPATAPKPGMSKVASANQRTRRRTLIAH